MAELERCSDDWIQQLFTCSERRALFSGASAMSPAAVDVAVRALTVTGPAAAQFAAGVSHRTAHFILHTPPTAIPHLPPTPAHIRGSYTALLPAVYRAIFTMLQPG